MQNKELWKIELGDAGALLGLVISCIVLFVALVIGGGVGFCIGMLSMGIAVFTGWCAGNKTRRELMEALE